MISDLTNLFCRGLKSNLPYRSTPRRDEIYGGTDDLLAAAGWEEDGYTTIVFRKPVASSDRFDHDFSNTLTFIYAHGQNNGNDFYVEDEVCTLTSLKILFRL